MNYLKKAAVCMTAAAMFTVSSFGFMPYESVDLPAITANAAAPSVPSAPKLELIDAGVCGAEGDNLSWELNTNGVLFITGTGYMADNETVFAGNEEIKAVRINDAVKNVGSGAFLNCTNLESIFISYSVLEIGKDAFKGCEKIREVKVDNYNCEIYDSPDTIPNAQSFYAHVNSYSYDYAKKYNMNIAFYPDIQIKDGKFEDGSSWFMSNEGSLVIKGNGSIADFKENEGAVWSEYKDKIKSITVANGINAVGDFAFCGLANAESVGISDSVTSIGDNSFAMCDKLLKVKLGKNVAKVGNGAFKDCSSMKEVIVENYNCLIDDSADTFPDTVTIYGYPNSTAQAYAEKYNRTFVLLEEKPAIEIIDSGDCGAIEEDEVLWMFDSEGTLTVSGGGGSMFFPDGNAPWNKYQKDIVKVVVEEDVTGIEVAAFAYCTNLKSVTISSDVIYIGSYAFSGCTSLESIVIPDGVTDIEYSTFRDCINLTSVTLPESIIEIGHSAFEGCEKLASIVLKNPECVIDDVENTIPDTTVIYGCKNSNVQAYAEKYNRAFVALDAESVTTTAVTTIKATTTTTKAAATTLKTTGLYPSTGVATTTSAGHIDYAPELEYDESPMKVGETRAIYVSDPTNKPVENIKVMRITEEMSYSYEKGSNVIYVTALKPGEGFISLMLSEGYMTNGAKFTIVEDTTETTTSTAKPTTTTTTTTKSTTNTNTTTESLIKVTVTTGVNPGQYAPNIEYNNSPMLVGETRAVYFSDPVGNPIEKVYFPYVSDELISYTYDEGTNVVYVTALKAGEAYIGVSFHEKILFNTAEFTIVNDASELTTTTTEETTTTTITTTTTTKNNSGSYETTTTTTAVIFTQTWPKTTTTAAPKTTTTKSSTATTVNTLPITTLVSTAIECYAPTLEYDDSPMKVGETRTVRFYNPKTKDVESASVNVKNDNISIEYKQGTDIIYVTALKAGEATISVFESGCAFYGYASFTIVEDTETTLGDVNIDGKIDSSDASAVLEEYANVQTGGNSGFTESQKKAADVNNDSKTDSADASKILAYYAMISTGKEPTWEE